jgi:hypothetical protein
MTERMETDWRRLCAAAAHESDSTKLAELVDQILRVFDERDGELDSPQRCVATADGPSNQSATWKLPPADG